MGMEDREWKMNEKFDEFTTCRGVFEHTKKSEIWHISQISNTKFTLHRSIWPITHLENVDFQNVIFWIGLLVRTFLKII